MTGRHQLAVGALVVGVACAIAFGATRYLRKELFPVQLGSKAPNFSAVTLDSIPKRKTLADYKGQVLMINVWATWCLPCRVEMPIVAVSIDDAGTEAAIRAFARQYGLTFEILHDPKGQITDAYDIDGYPETFVIGRDGIIRKKLMSANDWNSASSRALVERLLNEPSPSE